MEVVLEGGIVDDYLPSRLCRVCSAGFTPSQIGSQVYCSRGCRVEGSRIRLKERYQQEPGLAERTRERSRQWRERNPGWAKENDLRKHLLRKFQITLEEFRAIESAQDGRCAICRRAPGEGIDAKRLAVDHNHDSGAIRGLLCRHCNTGIGLFREDAGVMDRAAYYVRNAA